MSVIRTKDTSPELVVRKELHRRGLRFRLHRRDLPGTPDIALPKLRLVIFVHGCFWHQHPGCKRATTPATNKEFWQKKFKTNQDRDTAAQNALESNGWRVAIVWECETKSSEKMDAALDKILSIVR